MTFGISKSKHFNDIRIYGNHNIEFEYIQNWIIFSSFLMQKMFISSEQPIF